MDEGFQVGLWRPEDGDLVGDAAVSTNLEARRAGTVLSFVMKAFKPEATFWIVEGSSSAFFAFFSAFFASFSTSFLASS